MTKKDLVTLLAFLLFLTGFTSLTLSLVGIRWKFLSWINEYSALVGFLSQIGMILIAIIMLVVVNTSKEEKSD
jgi:hypothetical protein